MKNVSTALVLVFLCSVAAFGQSATGGFRFETEQGTQNVEFNAHTSPNGRTSGQLKFRGSADTPVLDVDGDGGLNGGTFSDWSLRIDVDCLAVRGNRASLSGLITEATQGGLVGRRMIFTVEDGGEGNNAAPDRFTWGLYRNDTLGWIPADAELLFDNGWSLTWNATDAENGGDPIPGRQQLNTDCRSFPLSAYDLTEIGRGAGNLQVRP